MHSRRSWCLKPKASQNSPHVALLSAALRYTRVYNEWNDRVHPVREGGRLLYTYMMHSSHSSAQTSPSGFSNGAGRTGSFAHPPRNIHALGIQGGMVVVDFGAGSGAYTLGMAERLQGSGYVYAIDVQQELLRRIKNEAHRQHLKNVETIWSDLESPGGSKIADHHADLVLISNLLFQVEHKEAVLAEAWRILDARGHLAIIDWSDSYGGMGPHKKEVVKKERALELADTNGFEFVKEFDAGAHHYGLMFRPKMR